MCTSACLDIVRSKAHQVGAGGLGEDALGGGPGGDERGAADQHRARHRPRARLLPRQHLRVTSQCMQRWPEACMSCVCKVVWRGS